MWETSLLKLGESTLDGHQEMRIDVLTRLAQMVHYQRKEYRLAIEKYEELLDNLRGRNTPQQSARAYTNQVLRRNAGSALLLLLPH